MKLCQIYNGAPVYREGIFKLIDKEFVTDWVFGKADDDIKQMDYSILKGKVEIVKNVGVFWGKAYWQKDVLKYIFKKYSHYLISGDERCLSTWLFLLLACLMPNKHVYLWTHGFYGKEGKLKRCVEFFFHNMADGEFIYNNYSRNLMIQQGLNSKKLFTIYNSLDYEKQLKLRNSVLSSSIYKNHFGNDYPVLLFVGRLTKVKKLNLFIDAVNLLRNKGNSYNIVFVGDGGEKKSLCKQVRYLELENNVWFYGACYDERTNAELIYNADLCVAPGNVGLTAMHTMVFGTPVISHNNFPWQMPEFEAICPGKTGDFFEMDNVESLAHSIHGWFSSKKDRETIRRACYQEIDTRWNPYNQLKILKSVLLKP